MVDTFDAYRARPGPDTRVELLKAQQDTVYNLCYQVLRHSQNAQDAAQQVLLSLLDALPRISDGAHLKQWLHRTAFHVSLDLKKVQKRRREREARMLPMAESPMPDEAADEIQGHVSRLDDDLRTLVVEHYYEQKPLGELAAERGCTAPAVWKKLERAREKLRDSLTRAGYASALPGLDTFFKSLKPVAAPKGWLSEALLQKAAAAAALGGIAVKVKTIASAAVLLLAAAGALSVAVLRRHDERPLEEARTGRPVVREAAASPKRSAPAAAPPRAEASPAVERPEAEEVVVFKSEEELFEAFRKAVVIKDDAARWKQLRRIGLLLTPEQFRRAEAALRIRPGSREYEEQFLTGAMTEWANADFKGFVGFVVGIPMEPSVTQRQKLEHALQWGAQLNRDVALAYARTLTEEEGRTEILRTLPIVDLPRPEAVLAMAKGPERDAALPRLVGSWAAKDPRAALEWIEQLSDPAERAKARSSIASGWAGVDVRAAAAWVEQAATGQELLRLRRTVIDGAAVSDPKGALELAVKALGEENLGCLEVHHALQSWGAKDPEAAAKFLLASLPSLDRRGHPLRASLIANMASLWAVRDPSAALEWTERLEGEDRDTTLVRMPGVLVKSILSTPKEALSLIDKLPEARRQDALWGMVDAWADFDPRAAAEFARSRPEIRVELDVRIARCWARSDLEASVAWVRTLPEGADRETALQAIAISPEVQRDPARASELAHELRDAGLRDRALKYVAEQLSAQDLQKAIAMTSEIVDPLQRKNAQAFILGRCGGKNPEACLALLNGMAEAGPTEYGAFAEAWAQKDPRAAVAWADRLSRPELREGSLGTAFTRWASAEPDAARAWVEQAKLSDEFRRKLSKQIPARR